MKIALIGCGKMGREVEKVCLAQNHEVILKIEYENRHELTIGNLKKCDLAFEFTGPETAAENFFLCFEAGIPVVSGSTGWLQHWGKVTEKCMEHNACFFYAPNFSIGVYLFLHANKMMASLMEKFPQYELSILEKHHIHKKDAPSGTAIKTAQVILENYSLKSDWKLQPGAGKTEIGIESVREGNIVGDHTVFYRSGHDEISLLHHAFDRGGLAAGAVLAAEFCMGKKGVFGMEDLMSL